jgi:CBS domain-containing protein
MNVEELMTQPVSQCQGSDTLSDAARLMWERDCGVIAVVDGSGRLTGMVTDRDVCMAAYTTGRPLSALRVSDAMSKQVHACKVGDSLQSVEHLMTEHRVRRIPVVGPDGRPAGMISLNDLARSSAAARPLRSGSRDLVHTLAAICEPRRTGERPTLPRKDGVSLQASA